MVRTKADAYTKGDEDVEITEVIVKKRRGSVEIICEIPAKKKVEVKAHRGGSASNSALAPVHQCVCCLWDKYADGNTYCPRPVPKWQKPITEFFCKCGPSTDVEPEKIPAGTGSVDPGASTSKDDKGTSGITADTGSADPGAPTNNNCEGASGYDEV